LDFSFYPTRHISTYELSPAYRLHRNFLTSDLVPSELDLAEGPFADVANKAVLVQAIVGSDGAWRFRHRRLTQTGAHRRRDDRW
jgi:hypothetical protein